MVSEFELIARYFTRPTKTTVLGIGDDCALIKPPAELGMAVTTDMLCAGTHFFADVDPQSLGHKSLAVNVSDIAAMGADPRWATLAIALPSADEAWIEAFARGLFDLADRTGLELIGGDTTRGPLTISITLLGTYPLGHALRRDTAMAGDDVWLSGRTGEAALAVEHRRGRIQLDADARDRCAKRLDWPEPRVALGRALRAVAHAAIDVSDGLVADLQHICERSNLAAELEWALVPQEGVRIDGIDPSTSMRCALAGGDDYELVFTAPAQARSRVEALGLRTGVAVTRIGRMLSGEPKVLVRDASAQPLALDQLGFDHFGRT